MSKWRDIRGDEIAWHENPVSQRAGYKVRMMCNGTFLKHNLGSQYRNRDCGGWSDLTLGQIADLGEKEWLRCANIGQTAVQVIKWIIDEAAEGRCPMMAGSGHPAPDAYVPRSERATPPRKER